jgi:hypothetical protein
MGVLAGNGSLAHLHAITAAALILAGYDTLFIDGGMLLHKAMLKNQQCALLGANYSSAIQWIAETCEKLRLYGL